MQKIIDELRSSSEFDKRLGEVNKFSFLVHMMMKYEENTFFKRLKNLTQKIDGRNVESICFQWFIQWNLSRIDTTCL